MQIQELAKLSGVSTRTLRYYDEIGLLSPIKSKENSYRNYSQENIDRLQQILFYKELDFSLKQIKQILDAPKYQLEDALRCQYQLLKEKRDYLNGLLNTIEQMGGNKRMSNEEKFQAFKQNLIDENEAQYGEEIRNKFNEQDILGSYSKIKDMTEMQYEAVRQLEKQLIERLQEAMQEQDTASELAMEVGELHKRWLSFYWMKYTKEAHAGLAWMYMQDERFIKYYDSKAGNGATQFLYDVIINYTNRR